MTPYREQIRATCLLAALRLRRLRNMYGYVFRGRRQTRTGKTHPPQNTFARAAFTSIALLFILAISLFSLGNGIRGFVLALYCHTHGGCDGTAAPLAQEIAARIQASLSGDEMLRGLAMLTGVLWLIGVLYPVTLSLRSGPGWDFEWISTLPMSRATLLGSRIVERGIVNPIAWAALAVPAAIVAGHAGAGWLTPVWTIAVVLPLLLTVSSIWTVLDMGLHIVLAPNTVRNLQSILGIVLAPAIFFVVYLHTPTGEHYSLIFADYTPEWVIWTPPGVAIQVLCAPSAANAFGLYGLLLLETELIILLSVVFLRFQLRDGLVAHGARESGRTTRATRQTPAGSGKGIGLSLSPIVWRELTLLLRDRRLLVQFFGVPLVTIGGQFLFNGQLAGILAQKPAALASVAFGVGAYVLAQSALQALTTEQGSLWLLYTFPRPIMRILREKVRFYFVLSLCYPAILCAVCLALSRVAPWKFSGGFALAALGLAIYSIMGVSIGVLAGVRSTWSRSLYTYQFLLLTGIYAYALLTDDWRREMPIILLCGALAFALWQKAADRLPYLLDPAAAPPSEVALADGLIAATFFFVLQIIANAWLRHEIHGDAVSRVTLAYVCAGALTYALAQGTFRALQTRGVPRILGPDAARALLAGAGVGLLCAGVGLAYLWLADHYDFAPHNASTHPLPLQARVLVGLLVVCAAPVFEEFIFRGLIFGGLRRSLNLPLSALGSAALFAVLHPPFSMLPVFVLGLGTAWVYARKQMLLASMTTHAVYNAVVVGYQLILWHG
ncbi:CPBP family intramembrane glutamic endopeptidase [Paraburkholderia sp. J12]|uniref:CPBP family intramembrane glutamic endopeptidase n=1 Tax=Paraburkholderia sp. J12 TaxID=2805432 RepID=UPI002ABDB45E|nr:CPBP family intramembrane glutamic endopeptidase [Paraburkholderia sp. J12]